MTSPDGTFVYGAPPAGWKVEIMTLDEELEIIFKEQGMGANGRRRRDAPLPGGAAGPIQPETSTEKLEYLPGELLMNGRPAMGAFKEEIPDMVRMYSISKHGGLMREMTADHVFAQVLAMSLQASMKVEVSFCAFRGRRKGDLDRPWRHEARKCEAGWDAGGFGRPGDPAPRRRAR